MNKIRNPLTQRFLIKIWNQIHRDNRDCIIAVCGGTGSGKSTIALWLAQNLDVTVHGESRFGPKRIIFGFNEWVTLLKDSHPYGTAIIMEEPQAYFNSRMFASKTNLDAIAKFSTGRIFQYLYILTYPSFERIDSQIRERIHYLVDTDGIDRDHKLNFWRPYEVSPNWKPNMPVFKKALTFSSEQSRMKMRCVSPRPTDELWDAYYEKSSEWKKMVKEGRTTNAGDVVAENNVYVDKRQQAFEHRRQQTRFNDLRVIEEKGLWNVVALKEITRRGIGYSQARRMMELLNEHAGKRVEAEDHKQYLEQLDNRT